MRRALRAYIDDLTTYPELFLLFGESQHIAAIPEAQGIVSNADAYGKTLLAIIEDGAATGVFTRPSSWAAANMVDSSRAPRGWGCCRSAPA